MTNQQLAAITAEERADLIADCKSDIDFFTMEINKFAMKKLPPSVMARMQSQIKRQQIALVALTAEPRGWLVGLIGSVKTFTSNPDDRDEALSCGGYESTEVYTAPPLPELKPIELPDLRQNVSGERYVWSDGVYNFKQDVIAAIRAAGYEVKS